MMRRWFDSGVGPSYVAGPMRRAAIFVGLSALLMVPASAWTQEEDPKPDNSPPPVSYGPIGGIDAAAVPNEEKTSRVEGMLAEQRKILGRVTNLLKEARAAKDIVQLNCINEKLTQIKGLLKISESASVHMYEAISSNQADIINHEFTKITVAHQRCVTLGAEAEQCVGEIAVYTGQTEVEVEVDENVPEEDPTQPPPVGPAPIIPPVASPV